MVELRVQVCSMNTSHEERQLCWRPVLFVLLGWLTQMDRHEEATRPLREAGELDPRSAAVVPSTLYRNHLGLSLILDRHLSGGYWY